MNKNDSALNTLQGLICHKAQPTKQPTRVKSMVKKFQ